MTIQFAAEGEEDVPPLRDGRVDLDLGVIGDLGPEVRVQPLYEDEMLGLVAPGHSLARGAVTLERLAAVPHVAVSRRGQDRGPLDDVLAQAGLSRRVTAIVPSYAAAAFLILATDLTGLIAGFAARPIAAASGAHAYRIPAPLPPVRIAAAWHARFDSDPAHRWLRALLRDVAQQLAGAGR